MQTEIQVFQQRANHTRYLGQVGGCYESFFLRANHPTRPLAFWIRYTVFSPKGSPQDAVGELWAVFFDGEANRHAVAKQEYALADCVFDTSAFRVEVGKATLGPNRLQGAVGSHGRALAWDLAYEGDSVPLLLLPFKLYQGGFPAAKSLVSLPLARFRGELSVDGEAIDVTGWVGSQNHNWGRRHTDLYAWGQVAGFDSHPESFLEVATARLKIGLFWTPPITPLVLRHRQREYALTGLLQGLRAKGVVRVLPLGIQIGNGRSRHRRGDFGAARCFCRPRLSQPAGGCQTLPQQQGRDLQASRQGQALGRERDPGNDESGRV
jgi:hypothetical protein